MMVETAKILINPPTVVIKVPPPHSEAWDRKLLWPTSEREALCGDRNKQLPVGRAGRNLPEEDQCQQQNSLFH